MAIHHESVAATIDQLGFALIQRHMPSAPTVDAMASLGTTLAIPRLGDIQVLKPRRLTDASPNIYSGNYGYGEFPLHTDLAHWHIPPRYLALRCVKGTLDVATRVLDGNVLIKAIGESELRRALVQPRRPQFGCRPLLRLLDRGADASLLLRWDFLFIQPATEKSAEIYAAVRDYLGSAHLIEVFLAHEGDTLILDNWRILHGRSSVPDAAVFRHVERVYMGTLQ
jgi:hypothetical protein